MMGLHNLKIGIIPVEARLPLVEHGSFALWDDSRLAMASASGNINSTDSAEIELHTKIFAELDRLAFYDDESKHLLYKAIGYFTR